MIPTGTELMGNVDLFEISTEIGRAAPQKVEHFDELFVERPRHVGLAQFLPVGQHGADILGFHHLLLDVPLAAVSNFEREERKKKTTFLYKNCVNESERRQQNESATPKGK